MDAELTALATAGATALVQQMVTDGWAQVRGRVAGFFSRGSEGDADAVAGELEAARAELVAAPEGEGEEVAADVLAEWRARMRRTLRADPAAAAELRALLDELMPPDAGQGRIGAVHNTIHGGEYHGTVIQSGTVGGVNGR
ncbi:hypothetical protein [Streptomyces sp. NPDC002855]|uniref:hypothetical protein n=1 Tax=Streptomyces sp. NPDC002855 TaxID=3154437 RepID=UPI00331C1D29